MKLWYPLAKREPRGCRRCGNCCKTVHLILGGIVLAEDKEGYAEYISHHHCRVFGVLIEDEGPEVMAIRVPLTCKYLEYDGNTGLASCAIYETRPEFCRSHLCNAAKGA